VTPPIESLSLLGEKRMSRAKRLLATPVGTVAMVGLLLLGGLVLSSCAEPEAIAAVPPTATVYAPTPTESPPPPTEPTPEALDFPLAPAGAEAAVEGSDKLCVECHTSEETLKAVAKEEEVVEELSEGEG
jgi:hypothetical protein